MAPLRRGKSAEQGQGGKAEPQWRERFLEVVDDAREPVGHGHDRQCRDGQGGEQGQKGRWPAPRQAGGERPGGHHGQRQQRQPGGSVKLVELPTGPAQHRAVQQQQGGDRDVAGSQPDKPVIAGHGGLHEEGVRREQGGAAAHGSGHHDTRGAVAAQAEQ